MEISINPRRGRLVFRRLLKALRANEYPYNIARLPQKDVPAQLRKDPLVFSQFIFGICHFMRGALKSEIAMRQLVALWHHKPELFRPEMVSEMSEEEIRDTLSLALNYHLDEIAGFWLRNYQKLQRLWRGDPRLIFKAAIDGDSARRLLTNKKIKGAKPEHELFEHDWGFEGSQGKLASMLAYFLLFEGLISKIDISPANDFHLGRVMLGPEVITVTEEILAKGVRYDQIYKQGEELLERFCKSGEATTVELGDALWILSERACRMAPGNASVGRSKKRGGKDKDGKKIIPKQLQVDPHNDDHLARYARSCARCPISDLCKWNVPSGPYYEVGKFMIYKRIRLKPRPMLFNELHDHVMPRRQRVGALSQEKPTFQLTLFKPEPDE